MARRAALLLLGALTVGAPSPRTDAEEGEVPTSAAAPTGPGPGLGADATWRGLWAGALESLRRTPELTVPPRVAARRGGTARLTCSVRGARHMPVSWVRRRDWHILSSGLFMYTNDERFQVLHSEDSDEWTLQIKFVQPRDNGTYECQMSTGAGVISGAVALLVSEPEAFILGAAEVHVGAGSDLSLVCLVDKSPVPPQFVFWFHNGRMLNYESGDVTVSTLPAAGDRDGASEGAAEGEGQTARTQSVLAVRRAGERHAGNYTCRAEHARPATVAVYVTEGSDKMAATLSRSGAFMQTACLSSVLAAAAAAAALRRAS